MKHAFDQDPVVADAVAVENSNGQEARLWRGQRDQSGDTDKQMRISKAGDAYLRRLLVGAAQYVLGPFGPDCALKRHGLKLAERGGARAKKKAVVAIARKLAVLMLALWKKEDLYRPLRRRAA